MLGSGPKRLQPNCSFDSDLFQELVHKTSLNDSFMHQSSLSWKMIKKFPSVSHFKPSYLFRSHIWITLGYVNGVFQGTSHRFTFILYKSGQEILHKLNTKLHRLLIGRSMKLFFFFYYCSPMFFFVIQPYVVHHNRKQTWRHMNTAESKADEIKHL